MGPPYRLPCSTQWTWTESLDSSDEPTQVDHYLDARLASDQANRCRRLAYSINDRETALILQAMAEEYERRASDVD